MGGLDYRAFLRALDGLDPDLPLLLEHMKLEEDYRLGVEYIRAQAQETGVRLR